MAKTPAPPFVAATAVLVAAATTIAASTPLYFVAPRTTAAP